MYLGDKGTGRVEHRQPSPLRFSHDRLGNPVSTEDGHRPLRHFVKFFDKARAFALQSFDHVAVMHDLMADVDGTTVFLQRVLDNVDGPHHARAKASRLGKDHAHRQDSRLFLLCTAKIISLLLRNDVARPRPNANLGRLFSYFVSRERRKSIRSLSVAPTRSRSSNRLKRSNRPLVTRN